MKKACGIIILIGFLGTALLVLINSTSFQDETKKNQDLERVTAINDASTILGIAALTSKIQPLTRESVIKTLKEEAGFTLPEAKGNQCYFYLFDKSTNTSELGVGIHPVAIMVGLETPTNKPGSLTPIYTVAFDGTKELLKPEALLDLKKPLGCNYENENYEVINLSQSSETQTKLWETSFVVPPHPNTEFDDEEFLYLFERSKLINQDLTQEEREGLINGIPYFDQATIDKMFENLRYEQQLYEEIDKEFPDEDDKLRIEELKREKMKELSEST